MAIHEFFAYLCVRDAARAIDYYRDVFGASLLSRLDATDGRVGHAELDFGGTTVMLCDEYPELGVCGPDAASGTSISLHIHVDNADELIERAMAAGGATLLMPAKDQFYGERSGTILDAFGHRWIIGHSIEEVTEEEMQKRYDKQEGPC